MNAKIILLVFLSPLAGLARADEKLASLQVGSQVYSNVNITEVSKTDVFFTHAGGVANAKLQKLSPALQKHFEFDPEKAKAAELNRAASDAQYRAELLRQKVVRAPDMTRENLPAAPLAQAAWRNDLPGAWQQAKSENKRVLIDFTGSDWCGWCIKFDRDVLSTERFAAYAKTKLVLVKLDFPHHTQPSEELKHANAALAQKFGVEGYPTFLLLNADGRELGRVVGYLQGGPDAFVTELETFSRR